MPTAIDHENILLCGMNSMRFLPEYWREKAQAAAGIYQLLTNPIVLVGYWYIEGARR